MSFWTFGLVEASWRRMRVALQCSAILMPVVAVLVTFPLRGGDGGCGGGGGGCGSGAGLCSAAVDAKKSIET